MPVNRVATVLSLVTLLACAPTVRRPPAVAPAPAAPVPAPETAPELPRGYVLYQNSCIDCHSLANDPYDKSEWRWSKMYLDTARSSDEELLRRLDDRASSPVTDQDRTDFIAFLRSLERKE